MTWLGFLPTFVPERCCWVAFKFDLLQYSNSIQFQVDRAIQRLVCESKVAGQAATDPNVRFWPLADKAGELRLMFGVD
jgi:hypothetical protein